LAPSFSQILRKRATVFAASVPQFGVAIAGGGALLAGFLAGAFWCVAVFVVSDFFMGMPSVGVF
jgi:hypothetical protein